MTKDRVFGEDTPLKRWIRRHVDLDSSFGYVGTDIDFLWYNHKKAMFMLQEHKENLASIGPSQEATLSVIDQCIQHAMADPHFTLSSRRLHIPAHVYYCGLHCIACQHTSPEDGDIYIDGVKVTAEEFLRFLQFEWTPVVQVYQKQQSRLLSCHSSADLGEVVDYIKQTVYSKHPEVELLRSLYGEKKTEIMALESLFTKDWEEQI